MKTNSSTLNAGSEPAMLMDTDTLRKLQADVSEEGLRVMLGVFAQELAQRIEKVQTASAERDEILLLRETHSLISIAGQFGALPLRRLSEEANYLCRHNDYILAFERAKDITKSGRDTLETVNKLIERISLS
jgi:HPt (histidine-containing phosphotransfer) domain-containing protein